MYTVCIVTNVLIALAWPSSGLLFSDSSQSGALYAVARDSWQFSAQHNVITGGISLADDIVQQMMPSLHDNN